MQGWQRCPKLEASNATLKARNATLKARSEKFIAELKEENNKLCDDYNKLHDRKHDECLKLKTALKEVTEGRDVALTMSQRFFVLAFGQSRYLDPDSPTKEQVIDYMNRFAQQRREERTQRDLYPENTSTGMGSFASPCTWVYVRLWVCVGPVCVGVGVQGA